MPKYKVEMIVEVKEGHPRKWIPETIAEQLSDGEDILELDIKELKIGNDDSGESSVAQFAESLSRK